MPCRPLTLRAFDRRLAAARQTSRFVARAKFKSGILTSRVKIAKSHIFRPMKARWRNKIYEF
ncbi:hypothetical protein CAMGR0001_1879 [Campylobacter gracilis RM3268]|uniref:Uncharacterized protein n=1 Tax=Campylobacter gracilis RM3268 TaxID=553220 RepID=C8PEH8_9BACT|nr:hypothetical protein CAMGR0001_1879 [Campylobacter gracilis RM3268]